MFLGNKSPCLGRVETSILFTIFFAKNVCWTSANIHVLCITKISMSRTHKTWEVVRVSFSVSNTGIGCLKVKGSSAGRCLEQRPDPGTNGCGQGCQIFLGTKYQNGGKYAK
jgi:hypothetical protein